MTSRISRNTPSDGRFIKRAPGCCNRPRSGGARPSPGWLKNAANGPLILRRAP